MVINIKYDKGATPCALSNAILKKAVEQVFEVLNESPDNIKWFIFDEKTINRPELTSKIKSKLFSMSLVFNSNYIYGFRPKNTSEIWISKQAIESFSITTCMIGIDVRNLLIRVILDELAHVKTNKDHSNKEYDNKLEEYYGKINSRYKSLFGI